MKTSFWFVLLVCAPALLAGCSTGTTSLTTELGGLETVGTDMGRYTAWALVEQKRLAAIKDVGKPPAEKNEPKVTVNLDSIEKLRVWADHENVKAWKELTTELARALRPANKQLDPTPFPQGAFAEGAEAVGNGIAKVGNTPGVVAGVVGHFMASLGEDGIDNAGDKVDVAGTGNQLSTTKEANTAWSQAAGTGVATSAPSVTPVKPEVIIIPEAQP